MTEFGFFFLQGLKHITDLDGYDHILFVMALTAVYTPRQWKSLAWLVTAFTVGHSIALALATLGWVKVSAAWIEFLIPVTILIACLYNIIVVQSITKNKNSYLQYATVLFFGLIHGLGFSNYIRMMLMEEEGIFVPLLGFNLGLEVGQLAIVAAALLLGFLFLQLFKMPFRWWNIAVSGIIGVMALLLAIERF